MPTVKNTKNHKEKLNGDTNYKKLVETISTAYNHGQLKAIQAVNASLLDVQWRIGQHIVEFEQKGAERAKYGAKLLPALSKDLSMLHGKGFSLSNLIRMRQFFVAYPIYATLSHKLGWSHYIELLKLDDALERSFYERQSINENGV